MTVNSSWTVKVPPFLSIAVYEEPVQKAVSVKSDGSGSFDHARHCANFWLDEPFERCSRYGWLYPLNVVCLDHLVQRERWVE